MNPEIKLSRLKQIDYNSVQNTANEFKKRSKESFEKMNSIMKKSKMLKCNSKFIEHKKIWNLEAIRLNNKKRKLQRDIDALINAKSSSFNNDNISVDLPQLWDKIRDDHKQFKSDTIDHVWTLCEDLKEWKLKKSRGYKVPDREPIIEVIDITKSKLDQVYVDLKREEECLTKSLESEISQYYAPLQYNTVHARVHTGIPTDAWDIECQDSEMLTDLLSQFLLTDSYFQTKLDLILEECQFVDNRSVPDDWPDYSVELFEHLHDTYFTHSTINRNQLWQDINRVVFPTSSQKILTEMEEFIHQKRVFREKTQVLITDWKYDRSALLNKIKATLIEYNEKIIINKLEAERVQNQKDICQQLNEKVNHWREQKEQLHSLEEAVAMEREEKNRIEAEEHTEKELLLRNKTKQKIFKYKIDKKCQAEKQIFEKERRIEELRSYLEKQALIDNERVEYRENLRLQRVEEQQERKQISIEKQRLSELRLNQLIEQVRPHVESDPERVLQPTTAWLHHTDDDGDQSDITDTSHLSTKYGNRYAVPIYTYSNKDVMSDPRCRVENALREAGLMNSEYARNIVKSLPTNHPPRRDCNLSDVNFLKHD